MATTQDISAETYGRHLMPVADAESLGLDPGRIAQMEKLIESHIADGRYPGAQIAFARHGKIAHVRTFGHASIGPSATPPPTTCSG